MNFGIVQVTNKNTKREKLLIEEIIPKCCKISEGKYTLVSPENLRLQEAVHRHGGTFSLFTAWDRDMSRKWRQGIATRHEEWVAFLADDILPDDLWKEEMSVFLKDKPPGQYGFRLTDENGKRHEFGEDWMQFSNQQLKLTHRPLGYDINTGESEQSPMSYVANCYAHKDLLAEIEPFGIYAAAPDVAWSMAIKSCGFPIGFNPKARAYHLGDRKDNRE
jgi:hypothetical protein